MPLARLASSSPHVQRSCLRCGYRGDELQKRGEAAAYLCPVCGQDLYARPPRSYAEMEDIPVAPSVPPAAKQPARRSGRAAPIGWVRRVVRSLLRAMGLRRAGLVCGETHARVSVRPTARRPRAHR